mgnify:CR=1 FL=1
MAALAADQIRDYEAGVNPVFNDLPVAASTTCYQGGAVGLDSGLAKPLADGFTFAGFANAQADNSAGVASDINVRVRSQGLIKIAVTGVTGVGDVGDDIYAATDNDFNLADTGTDVLVATVHRYVSGTTVIASFEAASLRSI